jgi:transmembrane sensor
MEPNKDMEYIEDLIIARLSGETTTEQNAFLDEMIEADKDVRKLWAEHCLVQGELRGIAGDYNIEAAWQKVNSGIDSQENEITESNTINIRKRSPMTMVYSVAAVLILLGVGGWYFLLNEKKMSVPAIAAAPVLDKTITFTTGNETVRLDGKQNTYSTTVAQVTSADGSISFVAKDGSDALTTLSIPQGVDRRITLSDSTKVWVNASTKLSFPLRFSGNTREVTLDGEAYFEVTHDKTKPFIVHTDGMNIQVLGTSFNVHAYKGEKMQTSLVEGKVEATTAKEKILLEPGKAAAIENGALIQKDFEESIVLAWMKGSYFFGNETIRDIAPTVDRWFGYKLTWNDEAIASIRFTGALEKSQNIEAFAQRLAASANLKYVIQGDEVRLEKR